MMNTLKISTHCNIPQDNLHKRLEEIVKDIAIAYFPSSSATAINLLTENEDNPFLSVINNQADLHIHEAIDLPYPLMEEIDVYALIHKPEELASTQHTLNNYWVIVGLKGREEVKKLFAQEDVRNSWGPVVLAGFGPGDPSLLTRKAEYNLHKADVIFYDDLTNHSYLKEFRCKKIYVGKRKGKHKFDQSFINQQIYQAAIKGNWVVRLKGGDPLIFGRGAEEYHYLASRFINTEIIPGITSAFSAAADAVIPLTERSLSSSVVFLSGHDLYKLKIPKADTLVFYMGASQQQQLAQRVIDEGWHKNTPVAIIHQASTPNQKTYKGTLQQLITEDSGLPSPSIIIIGKTVAPYSSQPRKWLYLGLSVNDWETEDNIVHNPLITIHPLENNFNTSRSIDSLKRYKRIIFTSKYAVNYFFKALFNNSKDARALYHLAIDCIGKNTAEALKEKGLLVEPLVKQESIYAMAEYYKAHNIHSHEILFPGSVSGGNTLIWLLESLGNKVTYLPLYALERNPALIKQNLEHFYGVIFTSPKTVEIFYQVYGCLPQHLKVKCKGSQTQKILEQTKLERIKKGA
jgi:uroporphyrinogen III methyltransferase/synthase